MSSLARNTLAALGLLAVASPAHAGTVALPQNTKEITITETAPEKDWEATIALYSWVTAVDGTVGVRGLEASAHTSMSTTLSRLNLAYMSYLEVRYKRWSIGLDTIYAKLSNDVSYDFGPLSSELGLELQQAFLTGRLQYRVIDTEAYLLDLYAGVRWSYIKTDIDIHTKLRFERDFLKRFNRDWRNHFDFERDWFDPIVGMRHIINLNPSWYLQIGGDIGGFGVGSKLTWQAMGGAGYRFNRYVSVFGAYRAMGIDYDKDNFKLDIVSHGPLLSLVFQF